MATVDLGTYGVCECCMLVAANGECCAEPHEHQPLGEFGPGERVALGTGEHTCKESAREYPCEPEECDCDVLGFSWSSCEGCGSPLGGDRYAVTVFRNVP